MNKHSILDVETRDEISVRNSDLRIMNAFAVDLISITSEVELAWYVVREVISKLGFVDCVVLILDKEKNTLRQTAAIGSKNPQDNDILNQLEIPIGEGITGRVAQTRKALIVDDLTACEFYIPDVEHAKSEICVPIMCGNHIYGVIDSEDKRTGFFNQGHLNTLTSIAALTAAKLQLIQKSRELVESERRNRLIFNASLDGIITIDEQGSLVECNQAALNMFGFEESDIVGQNFTSLFIPPDLQERYHESLIKLANSVDHRILDTRIETTAQRSDGVAFPVELTVTQYSIDEQRFFTGFLRDISVQKQADISRRQALAEAEKANKTKSEFLAIMSHELRTPLNAIIGFSEMLAGQFFGPLGSKRYEEYAHDILISGKHLLSLVNDILDLSAIEANELKLVKKEMRITEVVQKCSPIISELARKKKILFVEDIADDLCPLHADGRAVSKILINLLSNAVKFTPEGGKITLKISVIDEYHIIEVRDTGQGLPPDQIETLIKPFVRGQGDALKAQEGTGLGLAIVKSLVDLHAGELVIDSEVGKGTKIIVTLPNNSNEH